MSTSKRHYLPTGTTESGAGADGFPQGTLYVVATPIGNLKDITERARETLERVHTVLCEDTREGGKLISALGIAKSLSRLERLDAHAGEKALQNIIQRLNKGESFALITDAGTPAISDPGAVLVALAQEAGVSVVPIPGAAAVTAFLSVAGFQATEFAFLGFFPRKTSEQKALLEIARASRICRTYVWYESPRRILEALGAVHESCAEARVFAAKELTKIHERHFRGNALEVFEQVRDELSREGERGEWVFAVEFPANEVLSSDASASRNALSEESLKALHCLLDAGVAASEAARQVSHHFGAHKKSIYEAALKISGKKSEQGG